MTIYLDGITSNNKTKQIIEERHFKPSKMEKKEEKSARFFLFDMKTCAWDVHTSKFITFYLKNGPTAQNRNQNNMHAVR